MAPYVVCKVYIHVTQNNPVYLGPNEYRIAFVPKWALLDRRPYEQYTTNGALHQSSVDQAIPRC